MAMSAQAQQPQQHARRQEAADHNSDLLQRAADRSSSVQPDERGFSRNGDRSRRPFWHVKLKVFDISKGMAELYGGFFVSDKKKGIWHTNVVVFGLEYFYVSTICVCPVGMGWPGEEQLKEVLDVGTTERTALELEAFLRAQQRLFTPNKYDMFKHNCNHFSDLVLRFLNHRLRVPSYIASLPERVLQTTLGKLVYPLVNAAMDRTKSDICQHADKAELCGEIFFYGGATPLLVPGERSTQILMKRVVEEFKQQQLDAVAHRSSTAAYRSKSSYRRDRQADRSAFLGSRNNSQRAAAVAAFYSDAVLARRKDRARCTGGDESRVWPSPQPHGEPHLQQLRQQQIQQVQLRAGRATKEFQSGRACPGRRTLEGGITAAGGDVVPARIHEGFSSVTGEDSSVPGGLTAFNKEEGHFTGGGAPTPAATTHEVDERRYRLENWLTSSVLSECHRQPHTPQRRRSHVSPSPHASRPKTEDAEGAEGPRRHAKQQQTSCGSRDNSSRKDLFLRCQWRSHADFLHSADDARSGAAGAASAAVPRQAHQPAARRLRGISSAKWSDSSGSSQSSTHGNSLFVSTASPERVCRHAEGHAAGHATAPPRDAVRDSGDAVAAGEKAATWSSVRGPPTQLHRSPRGADACLRDGRPTGAGKGRSTVGVSLKPAAEVTAIRHPPFSPVSSSSTTVGSRISTQSSRKGTFTSGGSRSGAYARNASECSPFTVAPKGVKSRALQRFLPHAEDGLAGDRMGWFPLQSLRLRRPQTTEDTDATARARTRGYFQPPAASGAVAAERRSASDFSGSTSITKPGSWSCEARRDTGGIYPPTTRQGSVGGRSRSSDCSRSSDGGPPEDYLRCNRRPLLSLQHHHADASYDAASEEAAEKKRTSQDGDLCGNRRHTVTSGRLAPVEGDVGVEDASRSRQSSKYSSFSEPHDSCDGRETEWLQQQEWQPPAEEKQFEQQDQAQRLQATELDVTRNMEEQGVFLVSPEGCRISLAAGNTHSGLSSPFPHDSSALRRGLQWESHMRGRGPEHSSGTSIPRVRSGSCSDVRTPDVIRGDRAPGRGWKSSATGDGVDSSVWPPTLIRRRSASADSAVGESEPEWEDADEQEGTEESEKVDEESQSVKLWLPAVATRPPALREATGNAEDSSDTSEGQGTPADGNFPLKCSTSTVRPTWNSPSFESASDCCFLESAHEDDEVEGKEEFQEAKEERTSSDDEEQDTQRAEGIAKLGCEGSVSYSDEGGLVKRCAPSFLTPPAVPWQRGGRDGRARFTRQSPGKTYVAERQTLVASGVEETGGREERRATSPTTCSDWWQQQDQRDRNAARSSTFFPETRTEVAAIHQAPFVQREQEESLKEDFEQIRASFFPPASPAFTPR